MFFLKPSGKFLEMSSGWLCPPAMTIAKVKIIKKGLFSGYIKKVT